ncbi:hypothetical protein M407DRAFT_3772 [Tulasnella calospora MUT 4182]|uniref:Uncharacterized protein n=1 Tax=Tulasnella calospora MUT 4182 TaxID=1051891 RepID=A0A0C3QVN4_9AGAM|nr:hypothetical protein M407DRAFT_3772 [Tulasnella calospora MUT 4182]
MQSQMPITIGLFSQAFDLCRVGDTGFNYSYGSLSSRETRKELWSLSKTHPELYAHLASHHSAPESATALFIQPVFSDGPQALEPTLVEEEIDTDVSQAAAIAFISNRASSVEMLTTHGVHAVGGRLESNDNIPVCDSSEYSEEMSGALSLVALEQEVVLVEGEAVRTDMETAEAEELGRGKRRRRPNPHYSYSFYEAH